MNPQQNYQNMPQQVPNGQDFQMQQMQNPQMYEQQMQQMQNPQMYEQQMQAQQMYEQQMQQMQNPQMYEQQMQQMQNPQMIMPNGQVQQMPQMQVPQQIMPNQQMPNQQIPNGQMPNGQISNGQVPNNAAALPTKEKPDSTQATLLISEIRDNVVIMKDGSFRVVVACKSINFDLMSEMEREGVEASYQNFLNSLKFTTQILIRSQKVDIGPYLDRLMEIRRNNDNMLLGVLMDDYINFIDVLSQEANIMDKSFFIVIPYYTSQDAEKSLQETKNFFKTFSRSKGPEITKIDRATYEKAMIEISNRIESVTSGLFQIGIHSVRLNTKELAELYYNFNNPDTAVREPLVDFSKVATMYVKRGEKNENGGMNG